MHSLIPPENLFQMTVSTSPLSMKKEGSPTNFYFVTLADNVPNFKKAKLGDALIKQKVIGIDLDSHMGAYKA